MVCQELMETAEKLSSSGRHTHTAFFHPRPPLLSSEGEARTVICIRIYSQPLIRSSFLSFSRWKAKHFPSRLRWYPRAEVRTAPGSAVSDALSPSCCRCRSIQSRLLITCIVIGGNLHVIGAAALFPSVLVNYHY